VNHNLTDLIFSTTCVERNQQERARRNWYLWCFHLFCQQKWR